MPELANTASRSALLGFFFSVLKSAFGCLDELGLGCEDCWEDLALSLADAGTKRMKQVKRQSRTRFIDYSSAPTQRTEYPASMFNTQPVIIMDSSEARKTTPLAASSGV